MNTLFIGKNLVELASVDSTNNYAKKLLEQERVAEGSLVLAHEQHSGRGQTGNTWKSEQGKSLTMSLILYPEFLDASQQFYLNMAVSLGVKDFCESVSKKEIKIKWPNDIFCFNHKLGGILIENTVSGNKISSSVIGIGLNVNEEEFGEDLQNAVSLYQITNHKFQITSLVELLCGYLEKYYLQLRQLHFNFLDKAYTEAMYRYQQTHEFKHDGKVFRGEINGVTKEGKLLIHSNGKELKFAMKEVEFVF